jgi:hypothetical protein
MWIQYHTYISARKVGSLHCICIQNQDRGNTMQINHHQWGTRKLWRYCQLTQTDDEKTVMTDPYITSYTDNIQTICFVLRFQFLMATSVKMTVFWDAVSFCLIDTDQHFRGTYCLHQGNRPDDGGSKNFWHVSQYLLDYTMQHPRRSLMYFMF